MKIDLEYIKNVASIMEEKSLAEVCIDDGNAKLSLKRGEVAPVVQAAPIQVAAPVVEAAIPAAAPVEAKPVSKGTPVTSPMVGTFYSASSPDQPPYVKVGDVVSKGQVVCIVEAMKLMNEIEAEVSGKVVEICVENGQTIEFGQVLMYIE